MTNHLREDRIQDYVDDLLCREERAEVEQHLLICADCQAEVATVRDLVTGLHALEHQVQPGRDLLSGINARIDDSAAVVPIAPAGARIRERTLWSMRVPLAAAALALVALSAAITSRLMQNTGTNAQSARAPERTPNDGSSQNTQLVKRTYETAVDERYLSATDELERQLAIQRPKLAPETIQLVEDNLRIIDKALSETRGLLRQDPTNAALTDLMRSAYEKKLDVLRNATQSRGAT